MSKRINKNKGLSKKLKLQEKSGSKSGLEDFDDEILRTFACSNTMSFVLEKIGAAGFPKPGESIRIITKRSFNALEIIRHVLASEKILETYICVYSIDYDSAVVLNNMAKSGELGTVTFLISNLKNSAYRQKDQAVRELFLKNKNIKLVFAGSHAKIICFKTENNHYVVETSANIAPNSRIEQYNFENNKSVYDFHKQWIDKVDEIASTKELAIYDCDGKLIAGENKFKQYI
jgi:hypothetical protein